MTLQEIYSLCHAEFSRENHALDEWRHFILVLEKIFLRHGQMWKQDLALGESMQEMFIQLLQFKDSVMSQGKFKGYDLIADGLRQEIKADRIGMRTGNLCIEFRCGGKPSGIETTEADMQGYFLLDEHGNHKELYVIPTQDLKTMILQKEQRRKMKGGDRQASEFYLIAKDKLAQQKKGLVEAPMCDESPQECRVES